MMTGEPAGGNWMLGDFQHSVDSVLKLSCTSSRNPIYSVAEYLCLTMHMSSTPHDSLKQHRELSISSCIEHSLHLTLRTNLFLLASCVCQIGLEDSQLLFQTAVLVLQDLQMLCLLLLLQSGLLVSLHMA